MNAASEQSSKSTREERGQIAIKRLEAEILQLKGEKREEGMKAYRRLLASSADQLVYFMRSKQQGPTSPNKTIIKAGS